MSDQDPRKEHGPDAAGVDGLKDWETPELVVEDVQSATLGGTIGTVNSPGDDIWYQS